MVDINSYKAMAKKGLFACILAIGSVLISVAVTELGLRAVNKPHDRAGWRGDPGRAWETNQLGHRGQEISYTPDDHVVVLLGDSNVHAIDCAFDWMPEKRLEYYLNEKYKKPVKVFSVAARGWGPGQEYLGLKEYFEKYRADEVVYWFFPVNDYWNELYPTGDLAGTHVKPTYWLEQGKLKGPTYQLEEEFVPYGLKLAIVWDRVIGHLPSPDLAWENRLPPPYQPLIEYNGETSDDWQKYWDIYHLQEDREYIKREKSHWAVGLTPRSPRMQYAIDLVRAEIGLMHGLAKSKGAHFSIFTSETEEQTQQMGIKVHKLNGKFYKTSRQQLLENIRDTVSGYDYQHVVVSTPHPWVGPKNRHYNEHATDDLFREIVANRPPALPTKTSIPVVNETPTTLHNAEIR